MDLVVHAYCIVCRCKLYTVFCSEHDVGSYVMLLRRTHVHAAHEILYATSPYVNLCCSSSEEKYDSYMTLSSQFLAFFFFKAIYFVLYNLTIRRRTFVYKMFLRTYLHTSWKFDSVYPVL